MHITLVQRLRLELTRNLVGGTALLLAASGVSCSRDPGYRTNIYPGQEGQYAVERVPDAPKPADSPAVATPATPPPAQASAPPAPAQPAVPVAPADENLSQVQAMWPKLSDSDKALLAETARHLAAQK